MPVGDSASFDGGCSLRMIGAQRRGEAWVNRGARVLMFEKTKIPVEKSFEAVEVDRLGD